MIRVVFVPPFGELRANEVDIVEYLSRYIYRNEDEFFDWHLHTGRFFHHWPFWHDQVYPPYAHLREFKERYERHRDDLRTEFRELIAQSDVVVFIITNNWRKDSYIVDCIELAFEYRKPVIPLLIGSAQLPAEFRHIQSARIDTFDQIDHFFRRDLRRFVSKELALAPARKVRRFLTLTVLFATLIAFSFTFLAILVPPLGLPITPTPLWRHIRIGVAEVSTLPTSGVDGWTFAASRGTTINIIFGGTVEDKLIRLWGTDNASIEVITECQAINETTILVSQDVELPETGEYSITLYQRDGMPVSNSPYSITILNTMSSLTPVPIETSTPSSTLSVPSIGTSSPVATAASRPTAIQSPTSTVVLMDSCTLIATPTGTATELMLTATEEPE